MSNKMPPFRIEERPKIPFWQILHNDLTDDLKNERYIKAIYKKSISEINDLIDNKQWVCDDCGKEIPLKLPDTYEKLKDFVLFITNRNCCSICYECEIKTIERGGILGNSEGWYPDKDKLLEKVKREHEEESKNKM